MAAETIVLRPRLNSTILQALDPIDHQPLTIISKNIDPNQNISTRLNIDQLVPLLTITEKKKAELSLLTHSTPLK